MHAATRDAAGSGCWWGGMSGVNSGARGVDDGIVVDMDANSKD